MTAQALQPVQLPSATRIGQGTAVEQSRAVAEVQAAIVVAQQCPRDISRAVRSMQQSCAQKALADRAFFRFPRGKDPDTGKTLYITGPSVHLARELARCFGNVQYGISELRRDDGYGQSEMLAFAWDVETNTRSSTTFINPHKRDTKRGVKDLVDMRDVYENNANNGARRLREMIFSILPAWFTEDATAACYETLAAEGAGQPLGERVTMAVEGFATRGVTAIQLEQKLGAPSSKWSPHDLAQLSVIYRSIQRGEIRVEDEFPAAAAARVSASEVTGPRAAPGAQPPAPQPEADPAPPAADAAGTAEALPGAPGTITREQTAALWHIASAKLGFTSGDKAEWRQACEQITGRKLAGGTIGNLSAAEADALIERLGPFTSREDLIALLAGMSGGAQ